MASKKASRTANATAPSVNLPEPLFVDIREAARRLGVKVWTIRTLCWTKKIRFVRQGKRKLLFSPADLSAYAANLLAESEVR